MISKPAKVLTAIFVSWNTLDARDLISEQGIIMHIVWMPMQTLKKSSLI